MKNAAVAERRRKKRGFGETERTFLGNSLLAICYQLEHLNQISELKVLLQHPYKYKKNRNLNGKRWCATVIRVVVMRSIYEIWSMKQNLVQKEWTKIEQYHIGFPINSSMMHFLQV